MALSGVGREQVVYEAVRLGHDKDWPAQTTQTISWSASTTQNEHTELASINELDDQPCRL